MTIKSMSDGKITFIMITISTTTVAMAAMILSLKMVTSIRRAAISDKHVQFIF